jgi:hypothetical protein
MAAIVFAILVTKKKEDAVPDYNVILISLDSLRLEEYSFKRIIEKSMQWVDQNPGKRFFLFLHTYEIHHPYSPEANHLIRGQRVKRDVFAISQRDMLETFKSAYWAIMNEKWKLYDSKLYDLEHDPFEKVDVSESYMSVKWILRKRALRAMRLNGEKTLAGEKAKLDEMTVKRLKSLGYIR